MALAALGLLAGCVPNPRNEIGPIAEAAMTQIVADAAGQPVCVDRVIAPWQPSSEVRRIDPPAPPGFADLMTPGGFRGGGGIKGDQVGGARISAAAGCLDLRGPLVSGDRAMIEIHLPGVGQNLWLRRIAGDWRVVMTTTSEYPI